MTIKPVADLYLIKYEDGRLYKCTRDAEEAVDAIGFGFEVEEFVSLDNHRVAMLQDAEPVMTGYKLPDDIDVGQLGYVPDEEQCKPHPVMAVKGELGFLDHFNRIIDERDEDIDIGQLGYENYQSLELAALDAFRASMHQGASDGWVACSERMPVEGQEVIVMDVARGKVQSGMIYEDGCFVDFSEQYYEVENPSHWMPLPAAPQQEAK
ncbi:DUF551 domain-containing protein [Enterobacter chuandaensis]|uniref:DUF551 domain-containing protein n=1 Tax=Enterobacter chuandaensis TaxID=2497875 RepID=UPI0039C4D925